MRVSENVPFCLETCTQKSIRNQIIEGLLDGDTVEVLLQENNLTLASAISKCQGQEATKKERASLASQQSKHIAMLQRPQEQQTPVLFTPTFQGSGAAADPAGRSQCPAFSQTCFHCQKVGYLLKSAEVELPNTTLVQH